MKDGCEHRKGRQGLVKAFVALVLAAVMIILPSAGGFASVDDAISSPASLTVYPSGGGETEEFTDDIDRAGIKIDLYKVADVQKMSGYDTFEFVSNDTYGTLFNKSSVSVDNNDITNAEWRKLAQQAAAIALGTASGASAQTPVVTGAPISSISEEKPITKTDSGEDLSSGLYLVIARGDLGSNEYIKILEDGSIATIARSSNYEYTFEPELIALPTKDADGDEVINTANAGDWKNKATIYLKAGREQRKSSMEIIKTLDAFETKDPVTFVFQVDGVLGTQTYSNVFSLVFDGPDTKKIYIENLPVGMEMTVREVYSGNNYRLTTAAQETQTTAIVLADTEDDMAKVTFDNTYDDTYKGGGSIENKFTYDTENGWQWYGVDNEGNRYQLNSGN